MILFFIRKNIVWVLIPIVFSYLFIWYYQFKVKQIDTGLFGQMNSLVIQQHNYSTVFLGSSTTQTELNPAIFEKRIKNIDCFNFGLSGTNLYLQLMALEVLVSQKRIPRNILLQIDYYDPNHKYSIFDLYKYLPYYNNSIVSSFIGYYEKDMFFMKHLPFYKISKVSDFGYTTFLKYSLHKKIPYEDVYYKGYISLNNRGNFLNLPKTSNTYNAGFDILSTSSLNKILDYVKKYKINLIVLSPPITNNFVHKISNLSYYIGSIEILLKKNNVPYYNFTKYFELKNQSYFFYDDFHLNENGAEIYTNAVIDSLSLYSLIR